ncbi:MAG: sensor domain-containing diguanylate cyclase [Proteobacteria bacterium]|nr:sensor domain-containing diguanylate cyclase [Pseudomonadota bacterium]
MLTEASEPNAKTGGRMDSELLKELMFQLTVTKAMLKTVELEQILYIILSGITHGDGLNFNRAVLLLAWDRRNELRVTQSAGPANGEEAHRIWEGVKAEKLDLQSLLDRYASQANIIQYLTSQLTGFSLNVNEARPMTSMTSPHYELHEVIAHCVATKLPFVINGTQATYYNHVSRETLTFKNFACVPIVLNDEVLGIILTDNFFNSRIIHDEELRGLNIMANLASIALERAMLYRKLSEMAKADGLTGVFNRQYYESYLQDEFIRARRLQRALSMIVFDIDFFKLCNDTYGHERGDQVLRQFAQILRDNTREGDMVARYGGEEFVVLLTGEHSPQDSWMVGEKLRQIVASTAFSEFTPGQITVSGGVSVVNPNEDFRHLFTRADQALYLAKRNGRNCVILYTAADENESALAEQAEQ